MRIWIIALLLTMLGIPSVEAHPHVFITPKAVVLMNNHFVSQINVEWDFDDMSSSLFLESCGSNSVEIRKLIFPETQVLQNGSQVPRSGYYTNIKIDGTPIYNLTPTDFTADFVNGMLRCKFTLNINQNVNHTLQLWFDDPTIYNDFDIEQVNFQVIDQQSSTNCVLQEQTEANTDQICLTF